MRFLFPITALLVLCSAFFMWPDTAYVQVNDGIAPKMVLDEDMDLDVFVETINETGLKNSIEGYLNSGWVCMFLSTALDTEYGNGDRLYKGCVAFRSGSDWDAVKWDYDYDDSSSQGVPSIPNDVLTDTLVEDPTGTEGLTPILSDLLSWDYLLYVGDDLPDELYDELDDKDLKKVWVEHRTTGQEQMRSYWRYEDGQQSTTICVWSNVTNGQFGTINVN